MPAWRRGLASLALLGSMLATACSTPPTPTITASPSASVGTPITLLPSGCEPIELRAPGGDPVDLSGEWAGNWFGSERPGERTYALQLGDCVWFTVTDARFSETPEQGESVLGQLFAHLERDFSFAGTLVTLLRDPLIGGYSDQQTFAPVRILIEFAEDEEVLLNEDGQTRCTPTACNGPARLRRVTRVTVPAADFSPSFSVTLPPDWDADGSAVFPSEEGEQRTVEFSRDRVVSAAGCDLAPEPGVGSSASEIAAALAARDGLEVTGPDPVAIGGLSGQQIDLAVESGWAGTCEWSIGTPVVPLIGRYEGDDQGFLAAEAGERYRLLLLDDPAGGTISIVILAIRPASFETHLAEAMAILETLEFESSP